ncbi:MAG: putative competence-damage inducible protein [Alphaproteobacteria bacterium MarineAlpha9_Bin7]|nr:MAG: putative competence-damage inducible protein [Alphaproteobacteria bacterium MarineAlpha9_Bin7]
MRCEIVAIGTELLLGQIVDTNSSWIGEQLALSGIDSHFQTKVGDNFKRMEFCIRQGLERSDALICCGGLGPTQDDITRDVISHIMGVNLVRDESIVAKIQEMFESRGRIMTDNNRRQADIPTGASPIPKMPGTAPGLYCPIGEKVIYAVPGVPYEMREMMKHFVLPDLQKRSGQRAVIRSRVLRTWGNSESGLAEVLADRIEQLDQIGNPTLAFLASGIEGIKVRITAKATDEADALSILSKEETLLRALLGDIVFGIDDETIETVVLEKLRAKNLTLAVGESLTGGTMSSRLSSVDPEMNIFKGAVISAPQTRTTGVRRALKSAGYAREKYGTEVGIAVVVPDPSESRPRGTVYLGIIIGNKEFSDEVALPGDRDRLRNYAVISVMNYCRKLLS